MPAFHDDDFDDKKSIDNFEITIDKLFKNIDEAIRNDERRKWGALIRRLAEGHPMASVLTGVADVIERNKERVSVGVKATRIEKSTEPKNEEISDTTISKKD